MLLSRKEILDCAQKAAKVLRQPNTNIIQLEKNEYDFTITAGSGIGTIVAKAKVDEKGQDFKTYIDSKIFIETLKKLKSEAVELILKDKLLILKDRSGIQMKIPFVEYSIMLPEINENNIELTISLDVFKKQINECGHALGLSDNYSNFKAFYNFHIENESLTCIATDGYRIAKRGVNNDGTSFLLNGYLMKNIINSFESEFITIKQDENIIMLKSDKLEVYITKPQCQYCNMQRILQNKPKYSISCDREEFIEKLEVAKLVNPVMVFEFLNQEMQMFCNNHANEFHSSLTYVGEIANIRIGLNAEYLLESLRSIEDKTVQILIDNAKSPIVIIGEDYQEVILPISLR